METEFITAIWLVKLDKVQELTEYIEYYKDNLFEKINSLDISDKNSIIAITGKRSINGDINSQLFDGNFTTTDEKKLQFVGAYKYIMTE